MDKKRICIGIDQSYSCSGFSVWEDGRLWKAFAVKPNGVNSEKRLTICKTVSELLFQERDFDDTVILCEAVRTQGMQNTSADLIKAQASLIVCITDLAYSLGVETYTCNTTSWKKDVVGTSKPLENEYGVNPKKFPTIQYCVQQGYGKHIMEDPGKRKKGLIPSKSGKLWWPNDNIADAICIGAYYFTGNPKLHKEH